MIKFTNLQISAIIRAGLELSYADGKIDKTESIVIAATLFGFVGANKEEGEQILSSAESMNSSSMLTILSLMNEDQKKFVCGYLSTIIKADGKVDDSEIKSWKLILRLAELPAMSIEEARKYFV